MEDHKKPFWGGCETTVRDRRNQRRVGIWMLVWMATWLGADYLIRFDHLPSGLPTALAMTLPSTLFGVVAMLGYRRYLREADELRRKIEVEALALAVGVGLVGGFAYHLLEGAGVVTQSGVLVIAMLMIFTHAAGVVLGRRRYA